MRIFFRKDFKVSWHNATPGRCPSSNIEDKNALLIIGKTIRDDCISTDVSNPVNKEKVM
jgi:hypothetical protein